MNKTQLEYAVRRLDQIYSDKATVIRERNKKAKRAFDGRAFKRAVKTGKLILNSNYFEQGIDRYTTVNRLFDNLEDFLDKEEPVSKSLYAPVEKEYTAIRDQLYLGDAKEALALIEAFAAKRF